MQASACAFTTHRRHADMPTCRHANMQKCIHTTYPCARCTYAPASALARLCACAQTSADAFASSLHSCTHGVEEAHAVAQTVAVAVAVAYALAQLCEYVHMHMCMCGSCESVCECAQLRECARMRVANPGNAHVLSIPYARKRAHVHTARPCAHIAPCVCCCVPPARAQTEYV